ncbi:ATP-binding protein [Fischerella thermalis]|uniref:ATP-binding protein n=1 Tax=Fischerella thermalis TaxID=372787 RepID=UPI0019EC838C|nr:ATP-binding protein [Fischerella thermalis]MBF1990916.1 ATP-binding protein [Fischerella thermalis M58_A2018_009]MBF2060352.1 ATP-binding protein [Fischerella thermalis M66_A2018_004]
MATIDNIIKSEVNPFNLINIKPMNFWEEKQNPSLTVDSIHREVLSEIEEFLDLVMIDHRSRSILLTGDPGSGKSHLLGRLKQTLNSKAFFVYILCDWSDSGNIWRHVLRCTVDSLIQIPEQQQESQLILWLKSLSAFTKRNDSIWELLLSDRQKFIKHLKETYKTARIYNPDTFFGVLHDLTNPELYSLACEWLRGDCLSEESMQALKVKYCIETEDEAKSILANFGRISTETQPIVLCFDNLDTMPKLPDGFLDIQPFFDVNTTIHGENLKNFLIIISVITNTWNRHINRIQPADRAGIHKLIRLKPITVEQAETIWAYLLKPLHQQANPRPESSIYPLKRNLLEQNFPSGKTYPRNVINLGLIEYQNYKLSLLSENTTKLVIDRSAEFQLLWQQEFKKIQSKIGKISLLPATDLIKMVQEVLEALQVKSIKPKLLKGKYTSYSLSYQAPGEQEKIGIVWTEEANMTSFFHIMNACQKAIQENICKKLYLIRISSVGNAKLAGYKIYNQIFKGTNHHHIRPNLISVHYLATYHSLVNSAIAQELVLGAKTITLQELQSLTRETKILNKCALLQDLKIISKQDNGNDKKPVKDFMLNLVKTQSYMGVATLICQTVAQFPEVEETDLQLLMDSLCQEQKVKIINPKANLQDRLICFVNK